MNNRLERGEIKGMETIEEDNALCPEEKGGGSDHDNAKGMHSWIWTFQWKKT